MAIATSDRVTESIRKAASLLSGEAGNYNQLLAVIGNARFCLLGETTHGTHEFYRERAEITKQLIKEKAFTGRRRSRLARCLSSFSIP